VDTQPEKELPFLSLHIKTPQLPRLPKPTPHALAKAAAVDDLGRAAHAAGQRTGGVYSMTPGAPYSIRTPPAPYDAVEPPVLPPGYRPREIQGGLVWERQASHESEANDEVDLPEDVAQMLRDAGAHHTHTQAGVAANVQCVADHCGYVYRCVIHVARSRELHTRVLRRRL
jgi:hypothetical protein